MNKELAAYIYTYIKEEYYRGNDVTPQIIEQAIDAYEGGAR